MLFVFLTFLSCQEEELENLSNKEKTSIVTASRLTSSLPGNAEQGAMLHAHTWSFSGIEGAIPQIAAAGFNSV